jgi:hypothetical protein
LVNFPIADFFEPWLAASSTPHQVMALLLVVVGVVLA